MPGGGGDNIKTGEFILKEVMRHNDAGKFLPLWGTCLGFFRLSSATASNKNFNLFDKCDCMDRSVPLTFTKEPKNTKMYCDLGDKAHRLTKGNYTFNSHAYSLTMEKFTADKEMSNFWDVTSTSTMMVGKNNDKSPIKDIKRTFVSSMEAKKYPIMATIFHPDRMTDEFLNDVTTVNNNMEAIDLNRHFGDFLVNMAQANPNRWDEKELSKLLINTYKPVITGAKNINYKGELYIFK